MACDAAGHPMGSLRCSTIYHSGGHAGVVVGMSANGKLTVQFSEGTHLFLKEKLVTVEEFMYLRRYTLARPTRIWSNTHICSNSWFLCTARTFGTHLHDTHTPALKLAVYVHDTHL
jgi:hypothetical protein